MLQTTATLVSRTTVGPAQELTLHAPELARLLVPGQAVLVRCGWGMEPYLRRTFYPVAIGSEAFTIRVPPSGDWGHAWLRAATAGVELDCLGPVGRGFQVPPGTRNVLCLGVGEPAWTLLAAVQVADSRGLSVVFAAEAPTARDLISPQRLPAAVEYYTLTADGGRVARQWAELLIGPPSGSSQGLLAWAERVLAAGPLPFYGQLAPAVRAVRGELTRDFVQVLYPATFLCGVGACQGCVADVAGGRRRVCLRGPVFDLADVMM